MDTALYKNNALAGAGKTYTAIRWAINFAHGTGQKIAVVQPSKTLIRQTVEDCRKVCEGRGIDLPIRAIHGSDDPADWSSVRRDIMDHLKAADSDQGEILVITHAAFLGLPYWHRRDHWAVIFDEVPQVDKVWAYRLPRSHGLITDHLRVEEHDSLHYAVHPAKKAMLDEYAHNPDNDDVYVLFSEFSSCLLSPHWSVYVRKEDWHRHLDGETEHGRHRLNLFAMLEPSVFDGFKFVNMLAAMFDESMMNLYWAAKGVQFQEHTAIASQMRYHRHDNGDLLTIKYVFDDDWSKSFRNLSVDDDRTAWDYAVEKVGQELGGKEFIWVANNDIPDDLFGPGNARLPGVPNGLNTYQHIDNVVFLSALNRYPVHYGFLKRLGLDPEWVKTATGCQMAYQAMMRSSVRDPSNANPKTVIVPDQRTAEYLARLFPGCRVGAIDAEVKMTRKPPHRPKKEAPLSSAEKKVRERVRKKQKMLLDLLNLRADCAANWDADFGEETPSEKVSPKGFNIDLSVTDSGSDVAPRRIGRLWSAYTVNVFESIYSAEPVARLRLTNDELVEQLRQCHAMATDKKTNNVLLSAADFDPDKVAETKRGLANINYVTGIHLDNDGGDLTPHEFGRLFPDLRVVTFNTYSGGNRWRAFIPTLQVMTVDANQHVIRTIESVLCERGYYSNKHADEQASRGILVKRHGFDTSKFTPSSLFYLPVQAKDGPSFFHDRPGKELDPRLWVERSMIHDRPDQPDPIRFEDDKEETPAEPKWEPAMWTGIDDCPLVSAKQIAAYETTLPHSDTRYNGMFGVACSLVRNSRKRGQEIGEPDLLSLLQELDGKHGNYHQLQDPMRLSAFARDAIRKANP